MKSANTFGRVTCLLFCLASLNGLVLQGQVAPVLSATEITAIGFIENAKDTAVTSSTIITDSDSENLTGATIEITVNYHSGQDFLVFRDTLGIHGTWNSGQGKITLTNTAPVADYQAAIRNVRFRNTSENPSTDTRTVSISVNDGTSDSNIPTRDITVAAVNDIPVLSAIEGTALTYNENDAPKAITTNITASDPDNTNIASATVQITGNYQNGQDILSFTNAPPISGSWNADNGTMSLSGSATVGEYQAALRTVLYSNTSENPSALQRTVSFIINDGSDPSTAATRNITVNAVADPPVLTLIESSSLAYTENDAAKAVTSSIVVSDPDNTNLPSATVQITGNYQNGQDVLSFTNAPPISGSWNATNGTMSLNGSATVAEYQAALRNVLYSNTSENPSALQRTVTFIVSDGGLSSSPATRTITLTAANDPPALSSVESTALSYTENDAAKAVTSTLVAGDPDNTNIANATVQITGNYQNGQDVLSFTNAPPINGSWNDASGTMSLSGSTTLANYQAALRNVLYRNTSESPSVLQRTVTLIASDGSLSSSPATRTIEITAVNDLPLLSGIESPAMAYTENDIPKAITSGIAISDPDNANLNSATIQITGNYQNGQDVLSFTNAPPISGSWNAGNGTMTLSGSSALTDYQTALRNVFYSNTSDNPSVLQRTVSFIVNDGTNPSAAVARNINVTAVADAPVLSGIESAALGYTENELPKAVTSNITVSDPDNTNIASATVQITGNYQNGQDVLSFTNAPPINGSWNAANGTMSLSGSAPLASYQAALRNVLYSITGENPSVLTRTVTFIVNDGALASTPATRTITVTTVNDPPVLSSIEGAAMSYTENDAAKAVTSTIAVTDADNTNIASATVQITGNYQNGQDILTFTNAPPITGTWNATNGTMSLSGSAPLASYQAALRNVLYSNNSENPSVLQRTVSFIVNDGTDPSAAVTRNITLTAASDPPVLAAIEPATMPYTENGPATAITGSITVADPDNVTLASATINFSANYQNGQDELSFTDANGITGVWNAGTGTMTLSGTASLSNYQTALRSVLYRNTSDNPSVAVRTVSFKVNDGTVESNTLTRTITITPVNDKPVLDHIESTTISYNHGDGAVNITGALTAADVDNTLMAGATVTIAGAYDKTEDRLVYTTGNGIGGSFNINTGVLTLLGNSTVNNYQIQLRTVKYENISAGAPNPGTRTIRFVLDDGLDDSDPVSRNIAVNSIPVLSEIEQTQIVYCRNSGRINVTSSIVVSDPNDALLTGAAVSITGTFTPSQDSLYYTPFAGISGNYNASSGILTLTGLALKSDYQTVLRSVKYKNTQTVNPTGGNRIISFVVDDGKSLSLPESRTIFVDVPTAVISGTATICQYLSTNLSVALTGSAPWKFSYRRDSETPVEVPNVASTPRLISVNNAGTYTLTEITDNNNCTGVVSGSAVITITPAPDVTMTGLSDAYNLDNPPYPFDTALVSPGGGILVNVTKPFPINVSKMSETAWLFYPSFAGIGTYDLVYSYQNPSTLCYGYDTAVVRVLKASAEITFPGNRTYYCTNDAGFTITGANVVNAIGTFTIQGGTGLTDNHNNTATINPKILAPGNYSITYSYFDGTTLSIEKVLTIGSPPLSQFQWESECFTAGKSIDLQDKSVTYGGNIDTYKWKFFKGSGYDSLMTKNVTYAFTQPGNYTVELQIKTNNGCSDTSRRVFPLRPTIALAGETYFEDFEDKPVAWQEGASQTGGISSWEIGIPSKGFSSPGSNCWYTYIPTTSAPREQSMVTSPCFDFTGTSKPMIKLDIWRLFNVTRDGAVLQASADSAKTWQNIGELNDGINWFNEYNILGNPGNQTIGWSNARDAGWLESRHALDQLIGKKQIQFRIAYGSDGTARSTDGIAFDDVWIGERNKTALIEHFTNSSDADSKAANITLNEAVLANPQNIIDLQYHTSFPGADPLNADNPFIPEARQLYYGLATVPYSILDGGNKSSLRFDYDLRPLDVKTVLIESLYDSKFWINIASSLEGSQIKVSAEVMALANIPLSELTLNIVVVEEKVTGVTGSNGETEFRSVVKTMLPDAAGTNFYKAWDAGEYQLVSHNWNYENIYNASNLRVVSFMQNDQTKEVFQAAIDTVEILSSVKPPVQESGSKEGFIIFPDPAYDKATVRFAEPLSHDMHLEVYNNVGGLVFSMQLPAGGKDFVLPAENLPDGIYLVRISDSIGIAGTRKFTIRK